MGKYLGEDFTHEQIARIVNGIRRPDPELEILLHECAGNSEDWESPRVDAVGRALNELEGEDAKQVLRILGDSLVWLAMPVAVALARLREALLMGLGQFTPTLQGRLALVPGRGSDDSTLDGRTDDGLVRWQIVQGEDRGLTIRLTSWATGLAGTRVRLRLGTWEGEGLFGPFAPREVSAKISVPAEARPKDGEPVPPVSIEILEVTDEAT